MLDVKKLLANILTSASKPLASSVGAVSSLHNCTGTVSHNQIVFTGLENGLWFVQGRFNINSYVRTGANPGVVITLPSFVPTPTKSNKYIVGYRGQSPREYVDIALTSGSRNVTFATTESFTNAGDGTLTFFVNSIITLN